MGFPKAAQRNREIFSAHLTGISVDQLATEYRLTPSRVGAILIAERHKRAVSPELEYRELRKSGLNIEPGDGYLGIRDG